LSCGEAMIELSEKLIGACGLYCGWCPYYIVGTKEFKCEGCWSREKCEIRDCATSRGIKICTFCPEFPCQKLYNMYSKMTDFLNQIKKDFIGGIKRDSGNR